MLFTSVDSGLSIPVAHCKQQWGDRVAQPGHSAASGSSDDSIIPQQHDGEMSAQVSAAFVCLSRFHLTPVHGLLCRGETMTDLMPLILRHNDSIPLHGKKKYLSSVNKQE